MKLSAVWIVKNEELHIKSSILSVNDAVDELVVIDTGSTDSTVDICLGLGARTDRFEWTDDFAKARNHALASTTGDIVIFLDADECFSPPLTRKDRTAIETAFSENAHVNAVQVPIYNYSHGNNLSQIAPNIRIIRNNSACRYFFAVHEMLLTCDKKPPVCAVIKDRRIDHRGYETNHLPAKYKRNFSIMEKAIAGENDPFTKGYYSSCAIRELANVKMYDNALSYLKVILNEPDCVKDCLALLGFTYAPCIYAMLLVAAEKRMYVSESEIIDKIVEPFKRILCDYPGAASIDMYLSVLFKRAETWLPGKTDACLAVSDRKSQNVYETSFLFTEAAICLKTAQAALLRNDIDGAAGYALEAQYRGSKHDPMLLFILLSVMDTRVNADEAVAFLNGRFDISDPKTLRYLMDGTFLHKHKEIHLHYLGICVNTPALRTFWDIAFHILLTEGAEKAVQFALRHYNEQSANTVARIIFLVSFTQNDRALYIKYKSKLHKYADIAEACFDTVRLEADFNNYAPIIRELYTIIAFISGIERADEFAGIFLENEYMDPAYDELLYNTRVSYLWLNGYHQRLIDCNGPDMNTPSVDETMLRALVRLERFDDALAKAAECIRNGHLNDEILLLLSITEENAGGETKIAAEALYKDCVMIYQRYTHCKDIIITGYVQPESRKSLNKLKALTYSSFVKTCLITKEAPGINDLHNTCVTASRILLDKSAPSEALECCKLAYRCAEDKRKALMCMTRIFTAIGNTALVTEISENL